MLEKKYYLDMVLIKVNILRYKNHIDINDYRYIVQNMLNQDNDLFNVNDSKYQMKMIEKKVLIFPLLKDYLLSTSNDIYNINFIYIPLIGNIIKPKIDKLQQKVHYILLIESTLTVLTSFTKTRNVIKELDEYVLSTIKHIPPHKFNIFNRFNRYIYKNNNYNEKLISFLQDNRDITNYTILPYYRGYNKEVLSIFNYNL